MTSDPDSFKRALPPDIVLAGKKQIVVGRSSSCDVKLSHGSISREHARFVRVGDEIELDDTSTAGTTVNGTFIRRTRLKLGDLIRFASGPTYRFFGDILRAELEAPGLAVRFRNVAVDTPKKRLLGGINVEIPAGKFMGVLGPSGTGKSLLLHCLASTLEPTEGTISFDQGTLLSAHSVALYRSLIGFVPQTDLVNGALTVRENVRFTAELRMQNESAAEIDNRMDAVLVDVLLKDPRNPELDHQNKLANRSVLSGGQIKRVSIAAELLTRPRLLILDEPTSGLDPGMQVRIMDLLRGLARQGVTIVASTHTLDTLQYFDSVIMLADRGGCTTVVYQGSQSGLFPAYGAHDAADLFEAIVKQGEAEDVDSKHPVVARIGGTESPQDEIPTVPGTLVRPVAKPTRQAIVRQARVIARRSLLSLMRDRGAWRLALIQPFALGLLIILSQSSPEIDQSTYLHFFLVVAAIWLGMTLTVREFVRERDAYVRDRLSGMFPDAYLLGKCTLGAGLAAVQGIILYLFARAAIPFLTQGSAETYAQIGQTGVVMACLVLALASVGGAFMGLIISTLSRSEQAAIALLPLVILPQMLFSRVAYGFGNQPWSHEATPYCALADLGTHLTSLKFHKRADAEPNFVWTNSAHLLISLPLLSRPATTALDMLHLKYDENKKYEPARREVIEWLYLVILVIALGTTLYFVFMAHERLWSGGR